MVWANTFQYLGGASRPLFAVAKDEKKKVQQQLSQLFQFCSSALSEEVRITRK